MKLNDLRQAPWALARRAEKMNPSVIREILKVTERIDTGSRILVETPTYLDALQALPPGMDAIELLPRAVDKGVAYVPGSPFFAGQPDRRAVRLSFVTASVEQIDTGIAALAAAIREGMGGARC